MFKKFLNTHLSKVSLSPSQSHFLSHFWQGPCLLCTVWRGLGCKQMKDRESMRMLLLCCKEWKRAMKPWRNKTWLCELRFVWSLSDDSHIIVVIVAVVVVFSPPAQSAQQNCSSTWIACWFARTLLSNPFCTITHSCRRTKLIMARAEEEGEEEKEEKNSNKQTTTNTSWKLGCSRCKKRQINETDRFWKLVVVVGEPFHFLISQVTKRVSFSFSISNCSWLNNSTQSQTVSHPCCSGNKAVVDEVEAAFEGEIGHLEKKFHNSSRNPRNPSNTNTQPFVPAARQVQQILLDIFFLSWAKEEMKEEHSRLPKQEKECFRFVQKRKRQRSRKLFTQSAQIDLTMINKQMRILWKFEINTMKTTQSNFLIVGVWSASSLKPFFGTREKVFERKALFSFPNKQKKTGDKKNNDQHPHNNTNSHFLLFCSSDWPLFTKMECINHKHKSRLKLFVVGIKNSQLPKLYSEWRVNNSSCPTTSPEQFTTFFRNWRPGHKIMQSQLNFVVAQDLNKLLRWWSFQPTIRNFSITHQENLLSHLLVSRQPSAIERSCWQIS